MTDFEKAILRAVERIALALERQTMLAPVVEPSCTQSVSHEPAPSAPPGQPEDKVLEFTQGAFKGKKLSELDEKQLRQLVKGFQLSLQKAVDEKNADRETNYGKWVTLIYQWADHRGVKLPPAQP